jgi:plasmid stability protein
MAQLLVRNLDDDLVQTLKIRAAQHGRSAEEEHREILRLALRPSPTMGLRDLLLSMPPVGDDGDFERHDDLGREVTLRAIWSTPT